MHGEGGIYIDRLQRIVEDYKNGKITEDNAQHYLSFLVYGEDKRFNGTAKRLQEFTAEPVLSAENEYFEALRAKSITTIIEEMLSSHVITQDQFRVLWMYVIEDKTQQEIAGELGVSQQAIAKRIRGIQRRAAGHWDRSVLFKAITVAPQRRRREATSPRIMVRYPSEFAQHINVGTKKKANGEYKVLTKCVLPKMLEECFGDTLTKCPYCWDNHGTTCTCRDVN